MDITQKPGLRMRGKSMSRGSSSLARPAREFKLGVAWDRYCAKTASQCRSGRGMPWYRMAHLVGQWTPEYASEDDTAEQRWQSCPSPLVWQRLVQSLVQSAVSTRRTDPQWLLRFDCEVRPRTFIMSSLVQRPHATNRSNKPPPQFPIKPRFLPMRCHHFCNHPTTPENLSCRYKPYSTANTPPVAPAMPTYVTIVFRVRRPAEG